MHDVIPWEYVKLRIAINERVCSINAFAQAAKKGDVKQDIINRCQRSDTMLTEALAAIGD